MALWTMWTYENMNGGLCGGRNCGMVGGQLILEDQEKWIEFDFAEADGREQWTYFCENLYLVVRFQKGGNMR